MKKLIISKLFLYRYRFVIGYTLLGMAFVALLFGLPLLSRLGLSALEMESATSSFQLDMSTIQSGDLTDLPYHLLQKTSILVFGLTPYAIKLPSIIAGLFLGLLLILLLNRWFKSNVSLLASCLVVLSTIFLFLAGSGTPLIMLALWPTLLLWLGSKIQGEKRPKPLYCFLFAIALLFSLFTPYMVYFAIFCVCFVLAQPHLRFIVKSLPKLPLIIVGIIILCGLSALVVNAVMQPSTAMELLFAKDFNPERFFSNILDGFALAFDWRGGASGGPLLSPLVSLPVFSLTLIGLFSTTKGFFASRNSIATLLLVFTVFITGFEPNSIIFILLPTSILIAHGLKYLLEKWYGLFPENPYARVAAIFPLSILFAVILLPGLFHYLDGYRYNPNLATNFSYDLKVINESLSSEVLLAKDHYDFYKILETSTDIEVISELPESKIDNLAILHEKAGDDSYTLSQIITSPMSKESDIIYLYTEKGELQYGSDDGPNEDD